MTMVFARQTSSGLTSLVKEIDKQVAASGGKAGAFVVFLASDKEALKPKLEEIAAKEGITVPLTIAADNNDVVKKFKVNVSDNMPVNVLVYRDKQVKNAFNFSQVTAADVQAVSTAMATNSK
jgi:tagatose-1,6-bisphosphate aldolase